MTRRKRILANVFIIVSCSLMVLVLSWSTLDDYFSLEAPKSLLNGLNNCGYNVQYKGTAENGNVYHLKAYKVKELKDEQYEVLKPDLTLTTTDKKKLFVISDEMIYEKKTNIAHLKGNVEFKNDDGFILKTQSADAFINDGFVEGHEHVECLQGNTSITAIGFKMDNADGNVVFKNQPKMTLLR
jgi:LPS export ABC transporter protein LptC